MSDTWSSKRLSEMVTQITFNTKPDAPPFAPLLTADIHIDAPDCNRRLLLKHLTQAQERDVPVCIFGDLFDSMQSPHDKRRSYKGVRREDADDAYINAIVTHAADFLEPFAAHIAVVSMGNHETKVMKHQGVDLIRLLVQELRLRTGCGTQAMGFAGFIVFKPIRPDGRATAAKRLYFTHGSGGSSPVTKGVIKTARRSVYIPDADLVVSGHIHQQWVVPLERVRVTERGRVYKDQQLHIQLPSYKDEFTEDGMGFFHENEMGPRPLGGYWLEMEYDRSRDVHIEPRRAR